MNQFGYIESDRKLYKSKIADWQEGYMEKLCKTFEEGIKRRMTDKDTDMEYFSED